ncbi:hypothetical protein [Aquabacterium sp.]|uniref:hypothetical protein n=1 Tax=Aquabacterium sp. TaxID=1872578 RepID=UPI0035B122CD
MRDLLVQHAQEAAHQAHPRLDDQSLATMCVAVQMGVLERLTPDEAWSTLASGLMAPYPAHFLEALRACGGLKRFLPEVDALFGVPQLCDGPETIDVGLHQLRVVNETARAEAPLDVRFAALMHKIGMGGTLRDIWPSHYKHEQRAQTLLDGLTLRMHIPAEALDLARLVADECDRVHRASDMRAGAITSMLERLDAPARPARFERLLQVCTCDYAAYPGHTPADYPKAPRLRRALAAYRATDVNGLDEDAALTARAQAVARALRSQERLSS